MRPRAARLHTGRAPRKPALDFDHSGGLLGAVRSIDYLEQVHILLAMDERWPVFTQRHHRLAKAVSPMPGGIERFVALPASPAGPPDLDARRIPVVSL